MKSEKAKLTIFALLILLLAVLPSNARRLDEKSLQYWMNLPSAPLRFGDLPDKKGYTLGNYSAGHVIRYRLGCVNQQEQKLKVVSERPFKDADLPPLPKDSAVPSTVLFVTGSHFFPESICEKGKLAVTEVEFEDGAVWKARR